MNKCIQRMIAEIFVGEHFVILTQTNITYELKLASDGVVFLSLDEQATTEPAVCKKIWGVSDTELNAAEQYIIQTLSQYDKITLNKLKK